MKKLEPHLKSLYLTLLSASLYGLFSGCSNYSFFEEDYETCIECPLIFSEIQTRNFEVNDKNGNTPGWVEIQNTGDKNIDLKGLYLTDSLDNPEKWVFKSGKIKAHSNYILFFSEDGEKNYANWNLAKNGGSLFLFNSQLDLIDSLTYPSMGSGISYGINDEGTWGYFAESSPRSKNKDSEWNETITSAVTLETKAGFFDDSVVVVFPDTFDGATIRCSQDGSIPNDSSPAFTQKLVIRENTILRCAAFKKGALTTAITTNSYFVNEDIKMPVISISVDPSFFKDIYYDDGHACTESDGREGYLKDTEYPVHVEYFENGSKTLVKSFEIDAGMSISGNCTRFYPKKSVNIEMREKYQDGRLKYKLFDIRPKANKFKAFKLRNMGNRFYKDFFGDAAFTNLLEGTDVDYQRSQPAVVFYNGEYYGIHNIREKLDKHYVETNHGIDSDDAIVINHRNDKFEGKSTAEYAQLLNTINKANLSTRNDIDSLETQLDINNYINYMAFQIYALNDDWPNNNVRAWKSSQTQWRFMAFDVDFGFDKDLASWRNSNRNIFDWIRNSSKEHYFGRIFTKFMKNKNFERAFINHSVILFDTYFNEEKVTKSVNYILEKIDTKEMARDIERFPRKVSKNGNEIILWAKERDISVREDYREEFNLGKDISVSLSVKGDGYITVDGMKVSSTKYTGKFFSGNDLLLKAVPSKSGTVFKKWNDGEKENPRLVSPDNGDSYTAIFE